jgi:ribonuclease Z
MKVTILGNNSALPAFGRHPTAQTVSVHGEMLLIDCGEGTQIQMQRYGIKWRRLHNIFISHLHGDHYFGLPGLINSMGLMGRQDPLNLFAPKGLMPIIEQILVVADTTLSYPLNFHPLPDGIEKIVDNPLFTVTCFPVAHRIKCHGFLIESKTRGRKIIPEKCAENAIPISFYENLKMGEDFTAENGQVIKNETVTEEGPSPKRYAYCSDTLFTDSFLHLVKDADAIYHESTYLHEDLAKAEARFHSTAQQAAQFAKMANAGKLLLGHFSSKYKDLQPFYDEAAPVFPNVEVTVEGTVYEI